jgi:raffinose/stachyose/melibiose transport system permease protein
MDRATRADATQTGVASDAVVDPPSSRRFAIGRFEPFLYLLPAVLVFTLFLAVPVAGTVVISMTDWNGIAWDTASFVGVDNYAEAFRDSGFWNALWHNVVLIPFFVILPAVLGLIPAILVHQLRLRGARFFQAGLFLPYIMPGVLIGVVWRWILNPVFGPINSTLERVGIDAPSWLGDFTWALPTVGLIGAWAAYGFCYVLFVAGIQKISTELYEAARLDGAGLWDEVRAVTLPGLRREMAVVFSVNLILALRAFDVIRATTNGGPGDETQVLALFMISAAFNANEVGYGTAIAVLLAIMTLVLSVLVLRLFRDADD